MDDILMLRHFHASVLVRARTTSDPVIVDHLLHLGFDTTPHVMTVICGANTVSQPVPRLRHFTICVVRLLHSPSGGIVHQPRPDVAETDTLPDSHWDHNRCHHA